MKIGDQVRIIIPQYTFDTKNDVAVITDITESAVLLERNVAFNKDEVWSYPPDAVVSIDEEDTVVTEPEKVAPEGAKKDDKKDGKLGYNYIHPSFLYQVGAVMDGGAIKYDPWNYLNSPGHSASQLLNACKRHLDAWYFGKEDMDSEMSELMGMPISHLANAAACINMAIAEIVEGSLQDDRPLKPLRFGTTKSWFLKLWERRSNESSEGCK